MNIEKIKQKYENKIDLLDFELILAHILKKSREFVLTHPEKIINKKQQLRINELVKRRIKDEPLAYILGHKEFFKLDFDVDKNTLIPRPETEELLEKVLQKISKIKNQNSKNNIYIIDVGTGSGNIIVSLSKNFGNKKINYFGIDSSKKALKIAIKNSKKHKINKKIFFLHGNLLNPIIKKILSKKASLKKQFTNSKIIIIANLPYLSKKIYEATPKTVKNFEPRFALFSKNQGLSHYERLLKQIKKLNQNLSFNLKSINIYLEFSPEQKIILNKKIKHTFPKAKIVFYKDLSKKWRICEITL